MLAYILALTPDQNTLAIALLIPILGVISPLLLATLVSRNGRKDKELNWEREDQVAERAAEVAKQAAEAAKLVVERQEVLDKKTDEVARLVETQTTSTNAQLERIHGLVNSQMTAAIRSELAATRDTLALMSELIAQYRKEGREPTLEVLAAFKGRESKISELEETLRIREEADAASKLVNTGPQEVVIVNPDPVPVVNTKNIEETPEVVIVNEDPVPVIDTKDSKKKK